MASIGIRIEHGAQEWGDNSPKCTIYLSFEVLIPKKRLLYSITSANFSETKEFNNYYTSSVCWFLTRPHARHRNSVIHQHSSFPRHQLSSAGLMFPDATVMLPEVVRKRTSRQPFVLSLEKKKHDRISLFREREREREELISGSNSWQWIHGRGKCVFMAVERQQGSLAQPVR